MKDLCYALNWKPENHEMLIRKIKGGERDSCKNKNRVKIPCFAICAYVCVGKVTLVHIIQGSKQIVFSFKIGKKNLHYV